MEYFIQQLVNGVTLGSIYGLIAIGYTMVYGIIGMINFAHGDIFMIGAFIAIISFLIFLICMLLRLLSLNEMRKQRPGRNLVFYIGVVRPR